MSTSVKLTLSMIVAAVVIVVGALTATRLSDDGPSAGPTPAPSGAPTPGETVPGAGGTGAPSDPPLVRDDSPRLSEGSEATFVEFLDFECPACAGLFPALEQMRETYGDRVGFVVRYVPLHANSMNAFQAAEAAGEQGRYADMYVMLFERQSEWGGVEDDSFFFDYAEELGLDADQFATDFASDAVAARIEQSVADANELGVQGTPTLFMNGEQFSPSSMEDLEKVFNDAVE